MGVAGATEAGFPIYLMRNEPDVIEKWQIKNPTESNFIQHVQVVKTTELPANVSG